MTDENSVARDAAQQSQAAAQAIFQLFQNWLTRVESKIDTLTGRLEGKADRSEVAGLRAVLDQKVNQADFERLSARMDSESDRIDKLDKTVGLGNQRETDRTEWRRWIVPILVSIAATAVTVAQIVISTVHH